MASVSAGFDPHQLLTLGMHLASAGVDTWPGRIGLGLLAVSGVVVRKHVINSRIDTVRKVIGKMPEVPSSTLEDGEPYDAPGYNVRQAALKVDLAKAKQVAERDLENQDERDDTRETPDTKRRQKIQADAAKREHNILARAVKRRRSYKQLLETPQTEANDSQYDI